MKGWRSKLTLMLIIYFAGFATAVYFLAPSSAEASQVEVKGEQSEEVSSLSDEPVDFRGKVQRYILIAEDKTRQMGEFIGKTVAMRDNISSTE